MRQFFLNSPRFFAIFVALFSTMGVLGATPANAATFKGTIYETNFPALENSEIEYTLADGIFDTILASPINTFFIDGDSTSNPDPTLPMSLATVVPEVVTKFIWTREQTYITGNPVSVLDFQRSIFGITEAGLFLQILDLSQPPIYQNIFMSTIKAPDGLPLSACKTQACDASADFGGKGGLYGSRMMVTPVQPVPEPSAAVALGLVSALLLKRHRKTVSAQPVATTDTE